MNADKTTVMRESVTLSLQGKMRFPEVVQSMIGIGVERYHADYSRLEKTFYMPDGESAVVPIEHPVLRIADTFSAARVEATIRDVQKAKINYSEFLKKTAEAGCVGLFVQITGRKALYFGRNGEVHVEPFPTTK